MKATNYAVMAAMTIGCFGCSSMLPKMDTSQAIEKGGAFVGYMQNGKPIDPGDMADKLELEPEARSHVERARVLKVVSTILAGVGGALVGWPLGQWSAGESRPNWKLAAIGGGAIAVGIPLAIFSDSSMDEGVDAHNKRVTSGRASQESNSTAAPKPAWKPGERAGAQPVAAKVTRPDDFGDAFGFVFGTSKAHTAAACQKAGHQWSDAEEIFRCSGTPSTAISGASAELEFNDGGLSGATIIITPPNDAAGWSGMFRKTEGVLTQLYGKPMQRSFVVPDDCKAEDSFLGCVADGKVTGNSLWYLDAGYVATLTIVATPLPSTSTLHMRVGRPRTNQ